MLTIYSKEDCTFCDQAIMLCEQKGVEYEVKKLGLDIDRESLIETISAFGVIPRTMPQIVNQDGYVGGFNELKKLLAA
jgi:glutaredoxin